LFSFIGGQWDPSINPAALTQIPRPIYHYSLVLCGGLSILLFTLTVALVNPTRRFYLSKRTALTGGAALAVFAAVMGTAFLLTAPNYEWFQAGGALNQNNGQGGGAINLPVPAVPVKGFAQTVPVPTGANPAGMYPAVTPTVITAPSAAMLLNDQIAIYTAAAHQVVLKDSTAGGSSPQFPVIYLVSTTNDRTGSPDQPDAGPALLGQDLQDGIRAGLSDLSSRVEWVSGLEAVPKDPKNGAVLEGGLVITFGNIQVQTDGSMQLPASAYIAGMIGGGQTYRLEKVGGAWIVTGISGSRWIN
jgi:hypothetical protein